MRRLLLLITTGGLLAFGACSAAAPVGVKPTSSPTSSSAVSPVTSPSASAGRTASPASSESADDQSVEEQGDDSGHNKMTSFRDAHTYSDGVKVEVTTIRHGTVTATDVAAGAPVKKGKPWVQLTVRVTNGSKHKMSELVGDYELSFGPHKEIADPFSLPSLRGKALSGSIAPGESKVTASTFSVPRKSQDDVVLGFTADLDHDTTYFSGSIA